jgi:metal-responsive CopG/Arc/MetJ family transcriptional regulator
MINYTEKLYNEREYFREKTIIISVKMPESLFEKLEEYRRKRHISRSKVIRDAVEMMINNE